MSVINSAEILPNLTFSSINQCHLCLNSIVNGIIRTQRYTVSLFVKLECYKSHIYYDYKCNLVSIFYIKYAKTFKFQRKLIQSH